MGGNTQPCDWLVLSNYHYQIIVHFAKIKKSICGCGVEVNLEIKVRVEEEMEAELEV